jgi:hypothetical protein
MTLAVASADHALYLILLLVGVLCLCGAAWRAWLRDVFGAVLLLVVGVVILAVAVG